jgi:HTH-type transcriptional regulator / antitoxin HigA
MDAQFNNFALPPGDFIQDELEARGWSQADLAYILGDDTPAAVNQIISGKRGISADMAKKLGEAFGTSADLFANLQTAWELAHARAPDPAISVRSKLQSSLPLREMIRRGWIADGPPDLLERQVTRFLEQKSFSNDDLPAYAARQTGGEDVRYVQIVWLARVRQVAREMVVPEYDLSKMRKAMQALSDLRGDPAEVRHVPRVLSEAGVRFVVTEGLPGAKIDGVCTWLNDQSPVIGVTTRFDRIDNFWFVLSHECSHVLHGHGRVSAVIDADMENPEREIDEEERIANAEAADFCVRQSEMDSFFARKNPFFSERDVIAFAKRMGVHTGIVVGQLQRRLQRYDLLRRHQVRVREFLARSMPLDGWGGSLPVTM